MHTAMQCNMHRREALNESELVKSDVVHDFVENSDEELPGLSFPELDRGEDAGYLDMFGPRYQLMAGGLPPPE